MGIAEFPLGRDFLGYVLAVKAGTLYRLGNEMEAGLLAAEAKAIAPSFLDLLGSEPYRSTAIPIVYALYGSGELRDFSVPAGGRILVGSAMFGSTADIAALLDWGADPNYVHPDYGTAIHASILSDNVDVVRLLLDRGADPLAEDANGVTPYEAASGSQSESRKGIRQLLSEKIGMAAIRRASSPGEFLVMSGHYRTKTAMGEASWGDVFDAGEHLTYVGRCTLPNQDFACFRFMERDGAMAVRDLALPKDDLGKLPDLLEEFFD